MKDAIELLLEALERGIVVEPVEGSRDSGQGGIWPVRIRLAPEQVEPTEEPQPVRRSW